MDINNVVLVRATNIIPYNGVVKSINNSMYLNKQDGNNFSFMISDLLKEANILPKIDLTRFGDEEYLDEYNRQVKKIRGEYLPYTSDYNSMVLFSLNGLCPDDNENGFGNNTFSNKKCAVIEPLIHHIDEVVSLIPTDTAVKGDVVLSNDAVVFIEEEYFNSLSEEEKLSLSNVNVRLFTGDLKEVVFNYLKDSEQFIPEKLTLSTSTGGFVPSDTSQMQLDNIRNIALTYNKPQVYFFNIITGQNDDNERLASVSNEFENSQKVYDYYMNRFIAELLKEMNVEVTNSFTDYYRNPEYLKQLKEMIINYGLDNYKDFVLRYNQELELEKKNGTLKTPEEIINMQKEKNI